jgi:hypothetical protein
VTAPTEVLHALASLDAPGQIAVRAYLDELGGKLLLATSRELDAMGKVARLKATINHEIQNTPGLPPACRMHLMDAVAGLS